MFYDRYRELCEKAGKSMSRVALDIGFEKSTITKWKQKGFTPRTELLNKIADYFGVSTDYLLNGDNYKSLTVFNFEGTPGGRTVKINEDNFEAKGCQD